MAARQKPAKRKSSNVDTGRATSPLEWAVAAIGGLFVAAIFGFMVWIAFTSETAPPDVAVEPHEPVAMSAGHLVEFTAFNRGGSTAAQVRIEGRLLDAQGAEVDRAEATLDYVPKRSSRTGGLFFAIAPAGLRLELRATGYEEP